MDARSILSQGPLLFDGAMGTCYAARFPKEPQDCEQALLACPERIRQIHADYIAGGVHAIKTDTFSLPALAAAGEETGPLLKAAVRTAAEAAEGRAILFADLGPLPAEHRNRSGEIFIRLAEAFLQEGIRHFLIETLPTDDGIRELADALKALDPQSFLLVSYAVGSDGITGAGAEGRRLLQQTAALENVDAVGMNCVCGPGHMRALISRLDTCGKPLSVMPNAGYPTVIGRHTLFQGQPDYFAGKMTELYSAGARILGGCCGTTPEHIGRMVSRIRQTPAPAEAVRQPQPVKTTVSEEDNLFWQKLEQGKRVVALELDPPKDDRLGDFADHALKLHRAGADIITLADCPVGRPRADSSLLACKLHRELGIETLPHMTCRDRNLNATRALLLGLSMEGIRNVLIITGDPIPAEDRDLVRSVFNFNSRRLASYITGLNQDTLSHPFRLFGALNVNAVNFDVQLKLALEKEANGISGFLTQPVLSPQAEENLARAREALSGKLLGGIYPIVSHRNALFLNNEIAGIRVDGEIIRQYEGKDREEAEELACRLSLETAARIRPYTDGLYLMTPFNRVALMERILQGLKEQEELS